MYWDMRTDLVLKTKFAGECFFQHTDVCCNPPHCRAGANWVVCVAGGFSYGERNCLGS